MSDIKSFFRSSSFDFIVGEEKTRLTIHKDVLRRFSAPLAAMVDNGMMKESLEGYAVLAHVEEDIFLGFCEFAYQGHYRTPSHAKSAVQANAPTSMKIRQDLPQPPCHPARQLPLNPGNDSQQMRYWDNSTVYATRKSWFNDYGSETFGVPLSRACGPKDALAHVFLGLRESFDGLKFGDHQLPIPRRPILIFHAKLYVFATQYLIEPLRERCLQALHQCLVRCDALRVTVSEVQGLLEFTYQESGRDEPAGKYCSLRELVIHFAACESSSLNQDPRFRALLDQYAEMGSDLLMMLMK